MGAQGRGPPITSAERGWREGEGSLIGGGVWAGSWGEFGVYVQGTARMGEADAPAKRALPVKEWSPIHVPSRASEWLEHNGEEGRVRRWTEGEHRAAGGGGRTWRQGVWIGS